MERVEKEKINKKIINRGISYAILIASLFLFFFALKNIVVYVKVKVENKNLNEILIEMQLEKERLQLENEKMFDNKYYYFIVKGDYIFDGKKVSKINSGR